MMEGIFDAMIFFIGLKALLHKKDEDMGKRGKRKKKFRGVDWNKESEALDITSKESRKKKKEDEEDKRKPFEKIVLLPPREAQEGHY